MADTCWPWARGRAASSSRNPTPILDCPGLLSPAGPALAERLVEHLAGSGGAVHTGHRIDRVDAAEGLVTAGSERFHATFLLLATGARRRTLGVPGEGTDLGRGPSPAARRHGHLYRDRCELVRGQVELDAQGFIVTCVQQRTSAPRLYAAGDVCARSAWSVAAALGQAAIAVKDIERRLHLGD